jgi:glycosyltransferase involved in cell wall biosynthesis
MGEPDRDQLRRRAIERVRAHYSWDAVTKAYEQLFESLRTSRS